MPWPIFNRPSIQLGSLQSYLNRSDWIQTESHHPYLDIAKSVGLSDYREIALSGWAGEALFAPLVFPEMRDDARALFKKCFDLKSPLPKLFDTLVENIDTSCQKFLKHLNLEDVTLAGFSVCFKIYIV